MTSRLRRGFKSEANAIAREIRQELGLHSAAPLDPHRLAEHLAIPVEPLSSFAREIPDTTRYFSGKRNRNEFSAVTVFDGTRRLIVYNDAHSLGRQANDITHELAHALLYHEPGPALDAIGCRYWDEVAEQEADWLSGALLISEEAALSIARSGWTLEEAAQKYGVSQQLIRWRLNVTGAYRRTRRT